MIRQYVERIAAQFIPLAAQSIPLHETAEVDIEPADCGKSFERNTTRARFRITINGQEYGGILEIANTVKPNELRNPAVVAAAILAELSRSEFRHYEGAKYTYLAV